MRRIVSVIRHRQLQVFIQRVGWGAQGNFPLLRLIYCKNLIENSTKVLEMCLIPSPSLPPNLYNICRYRSSSDTSSYEEDRYDRKEAKI